MATEWSLNSDYDGFPTLVVSSLEKKIVYIYHGIFNGLDTKMDKIKRFQMSIILVWEQLKKITILQSQ